MSINSNINNINSLSNIITELENSSFEKVTDSETSFDEAKAAGNQKKKKRAERVEIVLEEYVQELIREKIGSSHGVATYIRALVYDTLQLPLPASHTNETDRQIDVRHVDLEFLPVKERAILTMWKEGWTSYDIMIFLRREEVACSSKKGWTRPRILNLIEAVANRESRRQARANKKLCKCLSCAGKDFDE